MDASPLAGAPVPGEPVSGGEVPEVGLDAVVDHLEAQVADVEAALSRLERGTYGCCEICGGTIDQARLTGDPTRARCADHDSH